MLSALVDGSGEYVLLMNDACIVQDTFDLGWCIQKLEATYAHSLHCALGKNVTNANALKREQRQPPMAYVGDGLYAWQFIYGEYDWHMPYNNRCTLYRKADIINTLGALQVDTFQELVSQCL